MTWIRTISEADADGPLAEAYASIRRRDGSVSNITEAASINPPVMLALADLLREHAHLSERGKIGQVPCEPVAPRLLPDLTPSSLAARLVAAVKQHARAGSSQLAGNQLAEPVG